MSIIVNMVTQEGGGLIVTSVFRRYNKTWTLHLSAPFNQPALPSNLRSKVHGRLFSSTILAAQIFLQMDPSGDWPYPNRPRSKEADSLSIVIKTGDPFVSSKRCCRQLITLRSLPSGRVTLDPARTAPEICLLRSALKEQM
jgi:hypothetical protein